MKARIKNGTEKKQFKPFTLEIDIETLEEAEDLWLRMNVGSEHIIPNGGYYRKLVDEVSCTESFTFLDEELSSQGWTPEKGLK